MAAGTIRAGGEGNDFIFFGPTLNVVSATTAAPDGHIVASRRLYDTSANRAGDERLVSMWQQANQAHNSYNHDDRRNGAAGTQSRASNALQSYESVPSTRGESDGHLLVRTGAGNDFLIGGALATAHQRRRRRHALRPRGND